MVELHKKRLTLNQLIKPQKKKKKKNDTHIFYSSKSFLTEAETIALNYSTDSVNPTRRSSHFGSFLAAYP